jgi:hypothetical protein
MTKKQKTIMFSALLILFLILLVQLALAALGQSIGDISQTTTDAGFPAMAISPNGRRIGIVWAERWQEKTKEGQAVQGPIFFRAALIEGTASDGLPLPKVVVDPANFEADQSSQPDIARDPTSNNLMHLIWLNVTGPLGGQTERIMYKQCNLSPAACQEAETEVASETSNFLSLSSPAIATSSSATAGVHAVWRQANLLSQEESILYSARQSNGVWTAPLSISTNTFKGADRPSIATATALNGKNYVHVVFVNDDNDTDSLSDQVVYTRGEVDEATGLVTTWTLPMVVPGPATDGSNPASVPDYPTVMAVKDTVVVAWDEFAGLASAFASQANEQYFALYNYSGNNGSSFQGTALDIGTDNDSAGSYTKRRSDNNDATGNPTFHADSVQGRRLQLRATFVPTSTVTISGTLHAVWHQTTSSPPSFYHDVLYATRTLGFCAGCLEWTVPVNETAGKKVVADANHRSYSAAADIVVGAQGALHGVYMESDEEGGFKLDQVVWNILFSSSVPNLTIVVNPTPTPLGPPTIYLPMVSKP